LERRKLDPEAATIVYKCKPLIERVEASKHSRMIELSENEQIALSRFSEILKDKDDTDLEILFRVTGIGSDGLVILRKLLAE
jgi:hypothetical protein